MDRIVNSKQARKGEIEQRLFLVLVILLSRALILCTRRSMHTPRILSCFVLLVAGRGEIDTEPKHSSSRARRRITYWQQPYDGRVCEEEHHHQVGATVPHNYLYLNNAHRHRNTDCCMQYSERSAQSDGRRILVYSYLVSKRCKYQKDFQEGRILLLSPVKRRFSFSLNTLPSRVRDFSSKLPCFEVALAPRWLPQKQSP